MYVNVRKYVCTSAEIFLGGCHVELFPLHGIVSIQNSHLLHVGLYHCTKEFFKLANVNIKKVSVLVCLIWNEIILVIFFLWRGSAPPTPRSFFFFLGGSAPQPPRRGSAPDPGWCSATCNLTQRAKCEIGDYCLDLSFLFNWIKNN